MHLQPLDYCRQGCTNPGTNSEPDSTSPVEQTEVLSIWMAGPTREERASRPAIERMRESEDLLEMQRHISILFYFILFFLSVGDVSDERTVTCDELSLPGGGGK